MQDSLIIIFKNTLNHMRKTNSQTQIAIQPNANFILHREFKTQVSPISTINPQIFQEETSKQVIDLPLYEDDQKSKLNANIYHAFLSYATSYATQQINTQNASHKTKTKQIKKSSPKQQKPTQFGSSLPSNINKKLINLVKDHLNNYNLLPFFAKNYLQRYEIHNQRQNVVIIPFLLLDYFLKLLQHDLQSQASLFYGQQNIQSKLQITKNLIKKFQQILKKILTQFRLSVQKSNQNKNRKNQSQTKQKTKIKQSYEYTTFINIAIYFQNQIPLLFYTFASNRYLALQKCESVINQQKSIKIQEQIYLTQYYEQEKSQFTKQNSSINCFKQINKQLKQSTTINCNQALKNNLKINQKSSNIQTNFNHHYLKQNSSKFIHSIFQSKQRQITKAHDKLLSIILNESNLRQIFQISYDFKLDLKQCLFQAYEYVFRRYFGQKKKKMEKQLSKNYQVFDKQLGQNRSLGQQFLVSLCVISLLEDKATELLDQFIDAINRKTQFLSDEVEVYGNSSKKLQNYEQNKLYYNKTYYFNFLRLLSKALGNLNLQKNKMQQKKQKNNQIVCFEGNQEKTEKYSQQIFQLQKQKVQFHPLKSNLISNNNKDLFLGYELFQSPVSNIFQQNTPFQIGTQQAQKLRRNNLNNQKSQHQNNTIYYSILDWVFAQNQFKNIENIETIHQHRQLTELAQIKIRQIKKIISIYYILRRKAIQENPQFQGINLQFY